ncbi:hypothetical protein BDP55DRAFT_710774 [Colletotrichum godetiae]|uniref:Uncharacterized protein n=1 Tax=Colletotrichum godetiae TaxID=1209918 RepID=A0AAJ0AXK8_9PEZI|nr:uncharacterized protein BDP55DRAFT_710774 [Colletotrichum godetiae]KAK1700142.1 hypothetical protein BDP55DRAFT_710774 [Colletotrichum godetiae]
MGDDEEERLFREVKYQRAMFKREWVSERSKHYERKGKERLERVGQQKNDKLKKVKSAVEILLQNVSRDEKRPLYYLSRNIMSKYDLFSEDYTARLCPDGIRTTRTIDFTDMASFHSMEYPRLKGTTDLKVDRVLTGCLSIDAPNNPDDDIRVEFASFECPQTTGVYKI